MASIIVPPSPTPIFDGSKGNCFENTLTGDTSPTIVNILPGEEYIFTFTQDATGSHALTWPTNVVNASDVNPVASSVTVQGFVCRANRYLYPTGTATYN